MMSRHPADVFRSRRRRGIERKEELTSAEQEGSGKKGCIRKQILKQVT